MLELMLLRHAKSDWDADYDRDRDRPLNQRGVGAARAIGEYLTRVDRVPDMALTSPAVRAHTTVQLAAEAGQWTTPIRVLPELYFGGPSDLLDAVRHAPAVQRLMVVSHEPTISSTVSQLIGGGSVRVPTAALVEFRLIYGDWGDLTWGSCELEAVTLSRTLVELGFGT